jgi:hypothetical protein
LPVPDGPASRAELRLAILTGQPHACDFTFTILEHRILTRTEIWRLEKYLRNLFRLDTITIVERPKQQDSVEVHVAGEFIGVLFRDEEDGEISYAFNMAILDMDLPEPPPSRTG